MEHISEQDYAESGYSQARRKNLTLEQKRELWERSYVRLGREQDKDKFVRLYGLHETLTVEYIAALEKHIRELTDN